MVSNDGGTPDGRTIVDRFGCIVTVLGWFEGIVPPAMGVQGITTEYFVECTLRYISFGAFSSA